MVKILKMCTSKLWGIVLVLYHKNLFCLVLLSVKIFFLGTLVQDRKKLLRLPKLQIVMILYKICHRYFFINKIFLLTVPRRYFFCGSFVLFMSCVCHAFVSVHWCLEVTWRERDDLLLVMFIVFFYFPMWYPGSDVVLDCIVSWSLLSFSL